MQTFDFQQNVERRRRLLEAETELTRLPRLKKLLAEAIHEQQMDALGTRPFRSPGPLFGRSGKGHFERLYSSPTGAMGEKPTPSGPSRRAARRVARRIAMRKVDR